MAVPFTNFLELGDDANDDTSTRQLDIRAITDHLGSRHEELSVTIAQDVHALTPENAFKPLDENRSCDQDFL